MCYTGVQNYGQRDEGTSKKLVPRIYKEFSQISKKNIIQVKPNQPGVDQAYYPRAWEMRQEDLQGDPPQKSKRKPCRPGSPWRRHLVKCLLCQLNLTVRTHMEMLAVVTPALGTKQEDLWGSLAGWPNWRAQTLPQKDKWDWEYGIT